MKKVIDGKMYNTETAEFLGKSWNGNATTDFAYCCEKLYRTKKGKFFLHGKGGAMTRYSQKCGNNTRCGGEGIVPLTIEEAREWVENHLDADEYVAIFGEVEEA